MIKKIVLSTDLLIDRDYELYFFELLCEMYKDAEVYCISHRPGLKGTVENRKIHSSFLSHAVKEKKDYNKYNFAYGNAVKKLFIPCSVDLVINLTTKISHGISRCEGTKEVSIVLDLPFSRKSKRSIKELIFLKLNKNLSEKSFKGIDKVYSCSPFISSQLNNKNIDNELISAPVNVSELKALGLFREKNSYILINTDELNENTAFKVINELESLDLKFKFVGNNVNSSVKEIIEKYYFTYENHFELAPLLSGSKCLISFSENIFSDIIVKQICSGRPVLGKSSAYNQDMYSQLNGAISYFDTFESINDLIKDNEEFIIKTEEKKNHGMGMNHSNFKFKAKLKRDLNKLLGLEVIESKSCFEES